MSDLIDRQTAIDELRERQHSAREWYDTAERKNDAEIMVRADSAIATFMECILMLKSLPSAESKMGRWIPCSERLPDSNGEYLVTTKGGEVYQDTFQFLCQWDDNKDNVTAWMPLPKPYQEDKQ